MLYKLIWRTGGVAQESECFPSKLKALSSSSRAAKKKKRSLKTHWKLQFRESPTVLFPTIHLSEFQYAL
jgi:hypothetical protein